MAITFPEIGTTQRNSKLEFLEFLFLIWQIGNCNSGETLDQNHKLRKHKLYFNISFNFAKYFISFNCPWGIV